MPERATQAQILQIADEAVAGTAETTGFKQLMTVGMNLTPQLETRTIRPSGIKYPSIAVLGKDWSQWSVSSDNPSYEDLEPMFLSVMGNVTNTVKNHKFKLNTGSVDAVKTFTAQKGETSTRWEQTVMTQMNELNLSFTRDAIGMSGSAFGRGFTTNTAAWGTGAAQLVSPVLPQVVSVFYDATFAGIGVTKLTRVLSANWGVTGRFNPLWVVDSAQTSYVATIEAVPEVSADVTIEADANGMAFVTQLRAGTLGFLSINAAGGTINGSVCNLVVNTSTTVSGVSELGDQDGVYAYTVSFTGIQQNMTGALPGVCEVSLDNTSTGAW